MTPGQNGPLYFFLLKPWLALAGQTEFAVRFPSVLSGVLAVPLAYRICRQLLPSVRWLGVLAALLVGTSAYLTWYSQEAKMYSLVVCTTLCSMWCFLRALEAGGWRSWLAYVVATGLGLYLHLAAALIVPSQLAMLPWLTGRGRRSAWRAAAASLVAVGVLYLPVLRWGLPLLWGDKGSGYEFVALHDVFLSLLTSFGLGVLGGASWWLLAPVVLALGLGLVLAEGKGMRMNGILWVWLLVPPLGMFLITLVHPLFLSRYLIFVAPALFLAAARGISQLARRSQLAGAFLLAAVLVVQGRGLVLQARTPLKADFRSAARYVADHIQHGDLILFQMPYVRHTFEYYWRQPDSSWKASRPAGVHRVCLPVVVSSGVGYSWAAGPYTNEGVSPQDLGQQMEVLTAGHSTVWLVESEAELWDARGLVRRWLMENAELTDEVVLVRVTVSRFDLRGR